MKLKIKRALLVLLAGAVLLTALAGCGGDTSSTADGSESTGSASEGSTASGETSNEEYRINVLVGSSSVDSSDETYIGQLIKEKFNVVFDYEIYAGDMVEKTNLQLAGGDYGDIVNVQWDNNVVNWIDAGAVIALDDLMAEYGADFAALHEEEIPLWRMAGSDGKLYKWETAAGLTEGTNVLNDVWIRSDVLEALGWPKLVSSDDWIEAIRKGKELFPTTEEGVQTEGICIPFGESWGMSLTQIFNEKGGLSGALGGTDSAQWDPVNEEYVDMVTDYMKENLKFYNTLWREGLMDPESFSMDTNNMTEKMNTGIPIAIYYSGWGASGANRNLETLGREDQTYVPMPIQSPSQYENNEPRNLGVWHSNAINSWMITDNAKDPARIMQVLNWFATEEGLNALGWGEEGVHYTVEEDGTKVPTQKFIDLYNAGGEEYDKIGFNSFPFSGAPDKTTTTQNGQYFSITLDPEVVRASYSERELEVLDQYGLETFVDMWHGAFVESELRDYYFVSPAATIPVENDLARTEEKVVQSRNEYAVKMIQASSDEEFEQLWEEMLQAHEELGAAEVIQFKNDQLAEMEAEYNAMESSDSAE